MQDHSASERQPLSRRQPPAGTGANDNCEDRALPTNKAAAHFHVEIDGRNFQFLVADDQIGDVIELFKGVGAPGDYHDGRIVQGSIFSLHDHRIRHSVPMLAILVVSAALIASACLFA